MSQPEMKVADVDVNVGKNMLRTRLLQGIAIILLPLVLSFIGLLVIGEPALQRSAASQFSSLQAQDRAAIIAAFNDAFLERISALGTLDESTRDAIARAALPEALSVTAIPLGNLGTVKLTPGDYGMASHIEIDLVRRAFNGESPPPEAVRHGGAWRLIYARSYTAPGGNRGVVMAELPIATIADLLPRGDSGQFALVQRSEGAAEQFIGTPLAGDRGFTSAQVGTSQWFVRHQVDPLWLSGLVSSLGWLLLAAGASLLGVLVGATALLRSIPGLLRKETDRILESAENKTALRVQVPPLLPLARLLRQMALLSRRQLITAARKSADAIDEPAPAPVVQEDETSGTDVLASEILDESGDIEDRHDGIPVHIFRSADIRGRTEDELTDHLVERISRAVAVLAQRRGVQTLAIACDGRPSSDRLRTLVVKTLLASGRDVVDLGRAPVPLLYFATHETEYDSGIMITGGHSDDTINGLRIVLQRQLLTHQGIQDILQTLRDGTQEAGNGRTIKLDVEADYLDKIALDISVAVSLKVVVDNNFGAAAHLTQEVFSALGCEVVSYNDPDNGQRPSSDWRLANALQTLGDRVTSEGADVGLLYDSDGDRLHTVTNDGQVVATDQLMMILARDLLERSPGADIVYDVQCTRFFAPFITRCGGRAVISRSGHANVRAKLVQTSAAMGGEFSGHIFMQDRWYGFNDGVYAAARLIELLSISSETYQDMLAALPQYVSSDDLSIAMPARECQQLLRDLTTAPEFPGSRVTTLDGLRIDYSDSWGLVQASAMDEALNFRFEGNDDEALKRVQSVVRKAIQAKLPDQELPF